MARNQVGYKTLQVSKHGNLSTQFLQPIYACKLTMFMLMFMFMFMIMMSCSVQPHGFTIRVEAYMCHADVCDWSRTDDPIQMTYCSCSLRWCISLQCVNTVADNADPMHQI